MIFLKNRNKVIPRSTYRLQFNKNFTLKDAIKLVPYFDELGISHIYASPLLKAVPGSLHCYDVCDYSQINPEIGTEEDLRDLSSELRKRSMGMILDIVPNHMGIMSLENKWWQDVLLNGQSSKYADFFDIDWGLNYGGGSAKIIFDILGDSIDEEIKSGRLYLDRSGEELTLKYKEWEFPINSNKSSLEQIIDEQYYVLTEHDNQLAQRNYRCFFDIASLARINVDNPRVFKSVHSKVFEWYEKKYICGFRIDHFEGLSNHIEYLKKIRKFVPKSYLVAEKYFSFGNNMEKTWLIDGTIGYDFLLSSENVYWGDNKIKKVYEAFTGFSPSNISTILGNKKIALSGDLKPEVDSLADLLIGSGILQKFSLAIIIQAIIEFISKIEVRRTYIIAGRGANETDKSELLKAINNIQDKDCRSLAKRILNLLINANKPDSLLVNRFQQLCVAAMAKSIDMESSRDIFGGDPNQTPISLNEYHEWCVERARQYPNSLNCLSTHDTKKSEDVSANLIALSENASEWLDKICYWSEINKEICGENVINKNIEYAYYMLLLSSYPISLERILFQVNKAYCDSNPTSIKFDDLHQIENFVRKTYNNSIFIEDIARQSSSLIRRGKTTSLSRTFLKFLMPGVPDTYQGTEIWDYSLADPDNRRPVDFVLRQNMLKEIMNIDINQIKQNDDLGHIKLWLIWKILNLKKARPELFNNKASYNPIYASGEKADCIISFARGKQMVAVASRFNSKFATGWDDTKIKLPKGEWRNFLSDYSSVIYRNEANIGGLLSQLPVALLVRC